MAESADSCAYCVKQGAGFKRCSVCKHASYCGVACQNADWKRHKKSCVPPQDVAAKINAAHTTGNWRGVLKWEERMEGLMAGETDDAHWCGTLSVFSNAHELGFQVTGNHDHARSYIALQERRIPLLGKLQRFRDQGMAMSSIASNLFSLDRLSETENWYQRARDVGAAHGFFSLESSACVGLGLAALNEGRPEESLNLLRNALVAAELNELDDPQYELDALKALIFALFQTDSIDEVEPLVLRLREAATAQSDKGGFCSAELVSMLESAHLHEVLCTCTPRLGTSFHGSIIASSTAA